MTLHRSNEDLEEVVRTLDEIRADNPEAATTHKDWIAAKLFMAGKITEAEYEAHEPAFHTDYVGAMMTLARMQIAREKEGANTNEPQKP